MDRSSDGIGGIGGTDGTADEPYSFPGWFLANWSRAALPAGVVMLLALPSLLVMANRALVLVVALLPLYMLHQYEEHAHGRFIAYLNAAIGRGLPVLTPAAVFWINILLVWAVFLAMFALARFVAPGFAFVPIYATLINAVTHIAGAVAARRYDPGLVTSVLLFVPWSILCLIVMTRATTAPLRDHLLGLLGGLLLHAIIVAYLLVRLRLLRGRDGNPPRPAAGDPAGA